MRVPSIQGVHRPVIVGVSPRRDHTIPGSQDLALQDLTDLLHCVAAHDHIRISDDALLRVRDKSHGSRARCVGVEASKGCETHVVEEVLHTLCDR